MRVRAATAQSRQATRLYPLDVLTNEGAANLPFDTLDRLAETLDRRCAAVIDQPDLIKATTHFEWWPDE